MDNLTQDQKTLLVRLIQTGLNHSNVTESEKNFVVNNVIFKLEHDNASHLKFELAMLKTLDQNCPKVKKKIARLEKKLVKLFK